MRERGLTSISAVNDIVEKQQQQQKTKSNRTKSEYIAQPKLKQSGYQIIDKNGQISMRQSVTQAKESATVVQFAEYANAGRSSTAELLQT